MKNAWFLSFTLVLVVGYVGLNGWLREKMSPATRLEKQLVLVERERKAAEFRQQLAAHQLADYQQQVATLMPEALNGKGLEEGYPLRQLASVITQSDSIQIERAGSLFEKAKKSFRERLFEESNAMLVEVITKYPDSIHVVEAHFLLAEGRYQLGELESSVETIEKMIALFPESELTGFALLRLGRVFEKQDRLEDAADIYRAVLTNFKQDEIARQARVSLKQVAL
ncbi:MAG: tetratricopeptide repeat protein [Bdellovibrionota bacterium]